MFDPSSPTRIYGIAEGTSSQATYAFWLDNVQPDLLSQVNIVKIKETPGSVVYSEQLKLIPSQNAIAWLANKKLVMASDLTYQTPLKTTIQSWLPYELLKSFDYVGNSGLFIASYDSQFTTPKLTYLTTSQGSGAKFVKQYKLWLAEMPGSTNVGMKVSAIRSNDGTSD